MSCPLDRRIAFTTGGSSTSTYGPALAKIILATRKLRWSSPLLFNDPFDVTQELRLHFDSAELNQAVVEEMIRVFEDIDKSYSPSGGPQRLLARFVDVARDKPDLRQFIAEGLRGNVDTTAGQINALNDLKKVWGEYVTKMRVLCLSKSNDDTAMWHHYAEACRGAVLQFQAVDQLDSAFLVARRVTYQDAPLRLQAKRSGLNACCSEALRPTKIFSLNTST